MNEDKKSDVFITTIDNPYDYFTQFEEWYNYDHYTGYNTLEYIGRLLYLGEHLSDGEIDDSIDSVFDEIVKMNPFIYKKVYSNKAE